MKIIRVKILRKGKSVQIETDDGQLFWFAADILPVLANYFAGLQ